MNEYSPEAAAIGTITQDELSAALTELARRTGNRNAYFPALATNIFDYVERSRAWTALGGKPVSGTRR